MVRIQDCRTCHAARPFVECDGVAVCYVCERTASGQLESIEARQVRRKRHAMFDRTAPNLSWGQARCYSKTCMKDVVPLWQGQSAFCPSCGHVVAALSKERDAAINSNDRAEKTQAVVRACIYCLVSGVATALIWGCMIGGGDSRITGAIAIGLLTCGGVAVANKLSLGKELLAWLFKRSAFRAADAIVMDAARRSNVFVRPGEGTAEGASWYPGRTVYFRVYEFKYGLLQLRVTCDGMIEIAAMAPREYGGGCMYPAPKEWDMWNSHCGQGYRIPQSNQALFLSKVTECSRWLVDAQAGFALGKPPRAE